MTRSSIDQQKLDEKKIIRELERNSKQGIDNIGKNCGFSRQKVWRIIKKLEEEQTIWGYKAVIDDERIGTKQFVMLIKSSPISKKDILDKIINLTLTKKVETIGIEIESGGLVHGAYDWMLNFSALDLKQVKKFGEMFIKEYPNLVKKIDILEYVFPLKKCGMKNPNIDKLKEYFV